MNGVVVVKPATSVGSDDAVVLARRTARYVSRAGAKLAGALDEFELDPTGLRCIDAGASTGGFTDCLLQRGAAWVVAVDVGTDQLHPTLRANRRVEVREQTDIRDLDAGDLGGEVDLIVADLAFISLRNVLPGLAALIHAEGSVVALVKPQFEAGREAVARGRGVVRDRATWRRVLLEVAAVAGELGLGLRAATVSSITGAAGNVEFMIWLQPGDPTSMTTAADHEPTIDHEPIIDTVVADAEARIA